LKWVCESVINLMDDIEKTFKELTIRQ